MGHNECPPVKRVKLNDDNDTSEIDLIPPNTEETCGIRHFLLYQDDNDERISFIFKHR